MLLAIRDIRPNAFAVVDVLAFPVQELADFTGLTAPYEPPESPELVLDAAGRTPEQCATNPSISDGQIVAVIGRCECPLKKCVITSRERDCVMLLTVDGPVPTCTRILFEEL